MPVLNNADNLWMSDENGELQQVIRVRRRGDTVWRLPVPLNTAVPTVSGAQYPEDTATATTGSWTNSPTSYAYQWQVLDGTWEDIAGETANTFDVEEIGEYRVRVIATNVFGDSEPSFSEPFIIVEPPPAGMIWIGGWRNTISDGGKLGVGTSDTGGQGGYVYTDPITGDVYVEWETITGGEMTSCGVMVSSGAPTDPGGWGGSIGYIYSRNGAGLAGGSQWAWQVYADESPVVGGVPEWEPESGVLRWCMAYRRSTGDVWFRQASSSGVTDWFGDGDPATDTDPTATFAGGGSGDVRVWAEITLSNNVRLIAPANHYGTAPTGFTAA